MTQSRGTEAVPERISEILAEVFRPRRKVDDLVATTADRDAQSEAEHDQTARAAQQF